MKRTAKMMSLVLALALGWSELGVKGTARAGEVSLGAIRIAGSQTMLALTRRLTEWYESRNKGVAFSLNGGSATQGFTSLIENKAEIAQSTRKALGGEVTALRTWRKLEFVEIPVATEFAVIAVNADNPVHALSLYDLRMILSGQTKNWKQVGGYDVAIHLYGPDETSEVRHMIDEEVMGEASFSGAIKILPNNPAVISAVAEDPGALAFCDMDPHPQHAVRLIGIKTSMSSEAIEPTGENLRSHRYTLSRTLYFYLAGEPSADVKRFTEWVLSSEGQLVVEAVGMYPLGSADREAARQRLQKH